MKRVVIVGTVNRDTLLFPEGRRTESLGGLTYTIAALAMLFGDKLEVVPVCRVGVGLEEELPRFLEQLPGVNTTGLQYCAEPADQVTLQIKDEQHKLELRSGGVPPVDERMLLPWLEGAGLLLNFTSGNDLTSELAARALRDCGEESLVDLHSLTLDDPPATTRSLRMLPDWQQWCRHAGVLQLTAAETFSITGNPEPTSEDLAELVRRTTSSYTQRMVVTMGGAGLLAGERDGEPFQVEAVKPVRIVDTTGCGDVLGAVLLGALQLGHSFEEALRFAVRAAAIKAGGTGMASVLQLREHREEILT